MKEFIAANGGIVAASALTIMALNMVLSGLKAGLEKIKDKTTTEADNKAYAIISSVSGFLSKVLDVIGYNPEHK